MGIITVGSFESALRIATAYGPCKLNRLHSNAWVVTPVKRRTRFTEKLRRKAEKK